MGGFSPDFDAAAAKLPLVPGPVPEHIPPMKKIPFRLTPYQVQFLLVVGFVTVGYALYLRYLAVELSPVALACDAGLQTMLCKARTLATAAGLFPLALAYGAGAKVQQPLAIAVIGGLAFAMLLSTPLAGGIYLLGTRKAKAVLQDTDAAKK